MQYRLDFKWLRRDGIVFICFIKLLETVKFNSWSYFWSLKVAVFCLLEFDFILKVNILNRSMIQDGS